MKYCLSVLAVLSFLTVSTSISIAENSTNVGLRIAALIEKPSLSVQPSVHQQLAAICFKTGEKTSGMNKICYYDCLGSEAAITISSV